MALRATRNLLILRAAGAQLGESLHPTLVNIPGEALDGVLVVLQKLTPVALCL